MKKNNNNYIGERQIIHFNSGIKRTIDHIVYIYENEMTHLITSSGTEWIINKNNVLCVEKIPMKKDSNALL